MSIPSPGRKGEVIYIPQEEGAAAVTSLTSRAGAQGREEGTGGLLFNHLTAVLGVGHQEEPFFPAGQIGGGDFPPLPSLHFFHSHHLPSHPGVAAGQPLGLSARALFLQLGPWWLLAAYASCLCVSSHQALFPPPPMGVLAGHLSSEAEALGEKQMAALLPLSPD